MNTNAGSQVLNTQRTMSWSREQNADVTPLVTREWLITNGLGGYASGTVAGVATRRYHGLLIAALPAPLGRMMMLGGLSEHVLRPDGVVLRLGGRERPDSLEVPDAQWLVEFRLEDGLPVWKFDLGTHVYEKRLVMPHNQNTTHILYTLIEGRRPLRLRLRPSMNIRSHDAYVSTELFEPYTLSITGDRYEVRSAENGTPSLGLHLWAQRHRFVFDPRMFRTRYYRVEAQRGYSERGDLWSPGYFAVDLRPGQPTMLTASVEPWTTVLSLSPDEAIESERRRRLSLVEQADPRVRSGPAAELVLAADQFLITPAGRVEDSARAQAVGDEVRTVIAGYHWFTDWGRDTMISLEGLTITTGRYREAGYLLRTFGHYVRDGLIPNLFPEGKSEGLYHTADATLWFFHALHRYLSVTGDTDTLTALFPKIREILERHLTGTRFGIGVDPADGLLRQGAEGYQLTWMDAKMGDWVVTPRRGKAVELNALWYNALRLAEGWARQGGESELAATLAGHAERTREAFNRRFWNESQSCLFDVVDGETGDDPACRPNQLFAIALDHPVLDPARWGAVLGTVERLLLTPVGLRSLAPGHPEYKSSYDGNLRTRDGAYHQGTVWAWLIGPFIDAWLKLHPDNRYGARRFLNGLVDHLGEAGLGTISEIFDAEPPYTPRGCMAQAWSVAEVLRCWARSADPDQASRDEITTQPASARAGTSAGVHSSPGG